MEAWVLEAETPRAAQHAAHPLRDEALLWMNETTVCVVPEQPPTERIRHRIERRLDHPVELRLDCEVAWYPLGRGYVVMTVTPPAEALPQALDDASPAFHELIVPADPLAPVRVCMPKLAVAEPLALAEALKAQGLGVIAVYEVGGCRR